ncbi:IMPACT family protein [Ruminococcus sp.]|uniref:IMPACT family protein n=1 Tax=Ruminococcus sp. TaxID=41978 RepID=UPI003FD8BB36
MMEYRTIAAPVSASFVEKKSEFIAQLFPARTQEEAVEAIEEVRKQHRRARHNVYAYLRDGNASRYSDDGEPQGTAGMPILDVLQKNGLTDVCCVVTRYFGGVLLGANGLVRAYSHSTALAIEAAQIKIMMPCYPVSIQTDYALYGKIAYHLPQEDILQLDTIFEDQVELKLLVRDTLWDKLKQELIDLTSGQVEIVSGGLQYADFSKAKRL